VFDIAWGEFVVIAVVALIVIGPKELPAVLRAIGQWTAKIRRMATEFQGQFQEALREAEMADLKKEVDDAAKGFTSQFDDPLNLKEATKWEPKPDAAQPDTVKSDETRSDDAKPDDAPKPADASPEPAAATSALPAYAPVPPGNGKEGGDEAFPVAGDHPAVAQMPPPSLSSAAGAGGKSGGASDAPPVTPPAAPPPEGVRGSDEGGVHP
jgi:sec-independent protein translocase protein TatB